MSASLADTARAPEAPSTSRAPTTLSALIPYAAVGVLFGIILLKSEVASWYRIQEMFRFQSFHMYGVLGSGFATAFVSLRLLERWPVRALNGESIRIPSKPLGKGYRYWIGGIVFGIGWALCGACPGPLFALIGGGATIFVVTALAALAGTWTYARMRTHLPH